jgi:alkylation response protein AidB-like acyl-CoA dehydrogenase
MDFQLSDEQAMFRRVLQVFVREHITPVARDWEREGRYPTEIVEVMKQMGLFGLTIPEDHGGMGTDMISFALVFEELSRGWMGIAGILGSHSLSCWMIDRYGTDEQRSQYLPTLATGERRTCIALTEPDTGSDLQGITTRAWRDGGDYVIRGTKFWITNARHADLLPVLVKTDRSADPPHRGMSILLVDAGSNGLTVGRDIDKLGYKGPESCEVVLDDVRVPSDRLLGGVEGRGLQQALSALEVGRINVAARSVGLAQAAYDTAIRFATQRHAVDRHSAAGRPQPIAEFQAIQIKLADIATDVQAARLLTWWAAAELCAGHRADLPTSMAKLFASEVALSAALESLRIHGGAGYSTELDVERLYRDAPLMAIGEGTSDILRMLIARRLLSGVPR